MSHRRYSHDKIRALLAIGHSLRAAATVVGCSVGTVRYVARLNGMHLFAKAGSPRKERWTKPNGSLLAYCPVLCAQRMGLLDAWVAR